MASKAVVLTPVTLVISAIACSLISTRSAVLLRSRDLSAALALGSVSLAALTFTTSTTDFNAAAKASASLPPAPSAAAAKEFTTLIICWLIFSVVSALAASTPAAKGLKFKGSTPDGSPKTSVT